MNKSKSNSNSWIDIVEIGAIVIAIASSLASIFLQQFLWATIPLSLILAGLLFGYQRWRKFIETKVLRKQPEILTLTRQNKQQIVSMLGQQKEVERDVKTEIEDLVDNLGQLRNLVTTELFELQKVEQENFSNTSKEITQIENSLNNIDSMMQQIALNLERVNRRQKDTSKLVRELKAIDIFSQNIKTEVNSVQSYFERGFAYQRLGNKNRAIEDYTKTIELSRKHAQAYHYRGLLYLDLGIYQKAILDLRKASQLYFDKSNLERYRETRDLCQQIHHQNKIEPESNFDENEDNQNDSPQVLVGNLFD